MMKHAIYVGFFMYIILRNNSVEVILIDVLHATVFVKNRFSLIFPIHLQ